MTVLNFDTAELSLDDLLGLLNAFSYLAGQDGKFADELAEDVREELQAEFYRREAKTPTDVLVKLVCLTADECTDNGTFATPVYREAFPHLPRFAAGHLRASFERHQIPISESTN